MHPLLQCVFKMFKFCPFCLLHRGGPSARPSCCPLCCSEQEKTRIANAFCKRGLDSLNHLVLLVGIPLADLALNSAQGDFPPLLC